MRDKRIEHKEYILSSRKRSVVALERDGIQKFVEHFHEFLRVEDLGEVLTSNADRGRFQESIA
jgi:hypothetical protein